MGFLEMTLGAGKEQVDVSVYGPDSVTAHSSLIAEDLGQILADHGPEGEKCPGTEAHPSADADGSISGTV